MEILADPTTTVVDVVATDSEWDENVPGRWLT